MSTTSEPLAETGCLSSSVPVTVTLSSTESPALPDTGSVNEQLALPPGARVVPMSAAQVPPTAAAGPPSTESLMVLMVTESAVEVFLISTV